MAAIPHICPNAVASHAACPLQIHATATLALLADARAADDHELAGLIEADLLTDLPATAARAVAAVPHNEEPPRG